MHEPSHSDDNCCQRAESPDNAGNDTGKRGKENSRGQSSQEPSQQRSSVKSSQTSEMAWEGSRRQFIAGAGSLTIAGLTAGCTSNNGDGSGGSGQFDGFFENVGNYNGVDARTGTAAITITVGAEGNGGSYAFNPPAVRITPGTTVTFEWVSNTHNVLPTDQPEKTNWDGEPEIKSSGYSFTSTFDRAGTYKYICEPHRSRGMKGAIVVSNTQN